MNTMTIILVSVGGQMVDAAESSGRSSSAPKPLPKKPTIGRKYFPVYYWKVTVFPGEFSVFRFTLTIMFSKKLRKSE